MSWRPGTEDFVETTPSSPAALRVDASSEGSKVDEDPRSWVGAGRISLGQVRGSQDPFT